MTMYRSLPLDPVFHASPNAYMLLDTELRFVAANRAYLELTGSRLEDLLGQHVIARFPHDDKNPENENARMLRASFEKVLATRERDHLPLIRYSVPREPGGPLEERFWSASHTPIFEAGQLTHILQHTVDVTAFARMQLVPDPTTTKLAADILERAQLVKQANISLDERVERLHRMFEQAPGFTALLFGPEHVFEVVNPAYRQVIGRERDVIGKPVREALPDIAGQGFYELLDKVYATGEVFVGRKVPIMLQQASDAPPQQRVLDFVYQPIVDGHGHVTGIFVQGNDITEQARAETERERLLEERSALLAAEQAARVEAEHANRLKDEFLATVSHELRTPLTAITGWIELYQASDKGPERTAKTLDTIERNARSLRQLVDDILDVSRIMSGKMEILVAPVRVDAAVEAAIEAVRPAAIAKDIRLQQTLDTKAVITGDAQRIQQVVWNLLSNAVKFTPKHGRVQVIVERRDSSVAITVADNGQGIHPDFVPHVFDRFRQADAGITRRHGGLGLGLAIVKQLVELHGGTVSCESGGPGTGAVFRVLLPVALSRDAINLRDADAPASVPCPPELTGLRVLVVEDEEDTRELLRELLGGCGMVVQAASSVAEAMELFQLHRPELVISDIGMPDQDGYTFVRWLRALPATEGRRVPAIALTAFARSEDRTAALRAGFRAHIPKPLDVAELLAVMASLVPERDERAGG